MRVHQCLNGAGAEEWRDPSWAPLLLQAESRWVNGSPGEKEGALGTATKASPSVPPPHSLLTIGKLSEPLLSPTGQVTKEKQILLLGLLLLRPSGPWLFLALTSGI